MMKPAELAAPCFTPAEVTSAFRRAELIGPDGATLVRRMLCGGCRGIVHDGLVFDGQEFQCPHCLMLLWVDVRDGQATQHPGQRRLAG